MWDIKISNTELSMFKLVATGEVELGSLAGLAGLSPNRASEILLKLEEKGFISEQSRRPKMVRVNNLEHSQALYSLFQDQGHIDWPQYLSGSAIQVLAPITDEFKNPSEMARGVGLKTVYNVLNKIKAIGAVEKQKGSYCISNRFGSLKRFLIKFTQYYNLQLINELNPGAWTIYNGVEMAVFGSRSRLTDKRVILTGVEAVPDLFPDLITKHRLYVITRKKSISREEHIIITLYAMPNEGRIERAVRQTMENEKNGLDIGRMKRIAKRFDIEELIERMV